jgi:hypothetical protein
MKPWQPLQATHLYEGANSNYPPTGGWRDKSE